ncbi:MAG: hypothetical protein ABIK09_10685 [Pseudomonadota bacterium]
MELLERTMPHRRRLEGLLSLALVLLVLSFVLDIRQLAAAAAAVIFLGLASVTLSSLLSAAWWGLTGLIGRLVSGTLLTLVYVVMVTPVGLLRRLLRRGPPSLRPLPRGETPALEVRDHTFGPTDFEKPW